MTIRLTLFAISLLLLPPLALLLSDQVWNAQQPLAGNVEGPIALSLIALMVSIYLTDEVIFKRRGTSLLHTQLNYTLWLGCTGAILGALLSYLNTFCPLWISPLNIFSELLIAALLGSVLLPAVLIVRMALSYIPGVLHLLTRAPRLPTLPAEPAAWLLLFGALSGLLAGIAMPEKLTELFWLAPLLLLISLQLFWQESTVFSGLARGDWSRVMLGALSGLSVCGGTFTLYKLSGGSSFITTPTPLLVLLLSAFGWLCLQLADLIAENGRGKKRPHVVKKKTFPIPVIIKKD
jgi:hypothetical protein